MGGGQPEHLRALGADRDRDAARPRSDRTVFQVASRVEGPFEVGMASAQERDDDLDRLREATLDMVLGKPERMRLTTGVA